MARLTLFEKPEDYEAFDRVLAEAVARIPLLIFQGRFRTFPIESDNHLLAVLRYVERNPLRATLCEQAEDRKYGNA